MSLSRQSNHISKHKTISIKKSCGHGLEWEAFANHSVWSDHICNGGGSND